MAKKQNSKKRNDNKVQKSTSVFPDKNTVQNKKPFYTSVGFWIITAFAMVLVVVIVVMVFSSRDDSLDKIAEQKKADSVKISAAESLPLLSIRSSSSRSALNGYASNTVENCKAVEALIKKFVSDAEWFDSCNYSLYVGTPDTSSTHVTTFSDGDYCAVLKTDSETTKFYSYTFKKGDCDNKEYKVSFD